MLGSEGGSAVSTFLETLNTSLYVLFTHVSHWDFEAWDGMGYATALKAQACFSNLPILVVLGSFATQGDKQR